MLYLFVRNERVVLKRKPIYLQFSNHKKLHFTHVVLLRAPPTPPGLDAGYQELLYIVQDLLPQKDDCQVLGQLTEASTRTTGVQSDPEDPRVVTRVTSKAGNVVLVYEGAKRIMKEHNNHSLSLDEGDVEARTVVIEELKDEPFDGQVILIFRLGPVVLPESDLLRQPSVHLNGGKWTSCTNQHSF